MRIYAGTQIHDLPTAEDKMNTDKILTGWNTWDTYSATTYVHMPEGYGVRIGLKEYLRGQYLQYPNIGRLGETDEK